MAERRVCQAQFHIQSFSGPTAKSRSLHEAARHASSGASRPSLARSACAMAGIVMSKNRWIEYLKNLAHIERYPFLRPFHHRAGDHALWAWNRDAVARGVALGVFFGILTPVAQIVFAILGAIVLRANIAVAAGSTLITNPFILPFVYLAAFRIGLVLTGRVADEVAGAEQAEALADVAESEEAAARALEVTEWIPTLVDWTTSIGPPLLIGVLTLAVSAALAGYLLVHLLWALFAGLRRRRR